MTDNTILDTARKLLFKTPPDYGSTTYDAFFELTPQAAELCRRQNTPESRLSFLMAYCYCKTDGQIYDARDYSDDIIIAAINRFGHLSKLAAQCKKQKLRTLKTKIHQFTARHRQKVITLLGRKEIGNSELKQLNDLARDLAEKQTGPEVLFDTLVERCIHRNWMLPKYTVLSNLINQYYTQIQDKQLNLVGDSLLEDDYKKLLSLLLPTSDLTLKELKTIEQSRKTRAFQTSSRLLIKLKTLFDHFEEKYNALEINDQATASYAHWVRASDIKQIKQLRDRREICLKLMSFIIYNYQERQDAIMVSMIANIRSDHTKYKNIARDKFFEKNSEEMMLMSDAAKDTKNLAETLIDLREVLEDDLLTDSQKIQVMTNKISLLLGDDKNADDYLSRASQLADIGKDQRSDKPMYQQINDVISALIKKYTPSVNALEFDPIHESGDLFDTISDFKKGDKISPDFLPVKKLKIWESLRKDENLLVFMLFEEIFSKVRSGKLSLLHSFNYKRLDRYFISSERWNSERNSLLRSTNLYRFSNFSRIKNSRTKDVERQFKNINEFLTHTNNHFLRYTRTGKPALREPKKGQVFHAKVISELLYDAGSIPVTDILRDIDQATGFFNKFYHSTIKHASRQIQPHILQAAIISQGCNIGAKNLFERSKGLKENPLLKAIRFRLTSDNLKRANESLLKAIDKLSLSKVFQYQEDHMHSSSDGQKWMTKHDSLLAQRSFKYFGQEVGLTRYFYVDDRNRVLSSRVFMPTKRESSYMMDGLTDNISDVPRLHSTDTHGFTEPIFAFTALCGVGFSPRLKDIESQTLYGTKTKKYYKDQEYRIHPSSRIRWHLIEPQWDNILHMMASVLTGHCMASQIFNRINSYSGDHPLYTALKELGRVEKTIFILRYQGSESLRNRIQKQLNLGEQTNRFSKAVCWGDGQKLRGTSVIDFERAAACTQLIQNAVVLWNYLYVSRKLKAMEESERGQLVEQLARGQMLAWRHVNFTGTFHFTTRSSPHLPFDIDDLAALEIPIKHNQSISDWPDDLHSH